jgi:hypothetical protein
VSRLIHRLRRPEGRISKRGNQPKLSGDFLVGQQQAAVMPKNCVEGQADRSPGLPQLFSRWVACSAYRLSQGMP